jgi:hypothetical protein
MGAPAAAADPKAETPGRRSPKGRSWWSPSAADSTEDLDTPRGWAEGRCPRPASPSG